MLDSMGRPPLASREPALHDGDISRPSSVGPVAKSKRLDISQLRRHLVERHWEQFRDVNGELEEEDALELYSMFSQIPPDLQEEMRERFKLRIVQLLNCIPGNLSSSLLLDFIRKDVHHVESKSWIDAVTILGYRHFRDAAPFLETMAFGPDYHAWTVSSTALLLIDPVTYMSRTSQAMVSNPNAATHYLNAVGTVALGPEKLDIRLSVPSLQDLFVRDYEQAIHHRPLIAEILLAYSTQYKATDVKRWLVGNLRSIINSKDERYSIEEKERHQAVLDKLVN